MSFRSLVLTRDNSVHLAFRHAFRVACIEVEFAGSIGEMMSRLCEQKFEAAVVDLDSFPEALHVLSKMRQSAMNAKIVGLAVVPDRKGVKPAYENGANFVLQKPVTTEAIARSLRAAHGLMLRERRRQMRYVTNADVHLVLGNTERIKVDLNDVSEQGFGAIMRQNAGTEVLGPVRLSFTLPGCERPIQGTGEVVWQRENGRLGVQFTQLRPSSRRTLERWMLRKLQQSSDYIRRIAAIRSLAKRHESTLPESAHRN
jgi:ActR/RegA family two-component response regulator